MQRLKNKIALITGGNSGIGEGIAERFYEEGAKVIIFGRNPETLKEVKQKIGDDVLAIRGDVTKTEDLKALYQKVQTEFGKIDIIVANAGVAERIPFEKTTEEKFDYMVDTNYRGVFFTVRFGVDLLSKDASVILIGSDAGTLTLKRHTIYGSAKAAVAKLAQVMAYDLAYKSIRVNSISPGYVKTPIYDARLKTDPDYLKRREAIVPLQRIGTPRDIANAALFLASSEASYITGIDLLVDGGWSASFPEPD